MTAPTMCRACDDCIYRRSIPGETHIRCAHPSVLASSPNADDPILLLASMLMGLTKEAAVELKIVADLHGIRSGWFMWPANFDPTWLDHCEGHRTDADRIKEIESA